MKKKILNALRNIFAYLIAGMIPFLLLTIPFVLAVKYSIWWLLSEIASVIIIFLIYHLIFWDEIESDESDYKQLIR